MIAFLALLAAGLLDAGDARRTTARVNEVVNRLGLRRVEETGLRARLLWVHDTWRDGLLDHWIHQLVIERLAMNDRVVYTLLRDPWIHRIEIHVEEDGLPYEEAIRYVTAGSLDPSRSIEEQFRELVNASRTFDNYKYIKNNWAKWPQHLREALANDMDLAKKNGETRREPERRFLHRLLDIGRRPYPPVAMPPPRYRDETIEAQIPWLARELAKEIALVREFYEITAEKRIVPTKFQTPQGWADNRRFSLNGSPLEFGMIHDVREHLPQILDWVEATSTDLGPLTWAQAVFQAGQWHEAIVATGGTGEHGVAVASWPDGASIEYLYTSKHLEEEGESLGHCVGGYWGQVRNGDSVILSYRTENGRPKGTVEISGHTKSLVQIQGVSNHLIEDPLVKARWFAFLWKVGALNLTHEQGDDRFDLRGADKPMTPLERKDVTDFERQFAENALEIVRLSYALQETRKTSSWSGDWDGIEDELAWRRQNGADILGRIAAVKLGVEDFADGYLRYVRRSPTSFTIPVYRQIRTVHGRGKSSGDLLGFLELAYDVEDGSLTYHLWGRTVDNVRVNDDPTYLARPNQLLAEAKVVDAPDARRSRPADYVGATFEDLLWKAGWLRDGNWPELLAKGSEGMRWRMPREMTIEPWPEWIDLGILTRRGDRVTVNHRKLQELQGMADRQAEEERSRPGFLDGRDGDPGGGG
jgi:hypothetical protein